MRSFFSYLESPLTTENNPRVLIEPRQGKVQDFTANVVEEDIKVADRLLEVIDERGALVVDSLVHAELLLEPLAFLVRPRNSDDLRSKNLTDLTREGTHGAGGARDQEGLSRLDLSDINQTLGSMVQSVDGMMGVKKWSYKIGGQA